MVAFDPVTLTETSSTQVKLLVSSPEYRRHSIIKPSRVPPLESKVQVWLICSQPMSVVYAVLPLAEPEKLVGSSVPVV